MTEKFIPFQQEEMDNPGDICCDYGDDVGSCSDRFILRVAKAAQAASQAYTWKNVVTDDGGGFVDDVIFNQKKGLDLCPH